MGLLMSFLLPDFVPKNLKTCQKWAFCSRFCRTKKKTSSASRSHWGKKIHKPALLADPPKRGPLGFPLSKFGPVAINPPPEAALGRPRSQEWSESPKLGFLGPSSPRKEGGGSARPLLSIPFPGTDVKNDIHSSQQQYSGIIFWGACIKTFKCLKIWLKNFVRNVLKCHKNLDRRNFIQPSENEVPKSRQKQAIPRRKRMISWITGS